MNRYVFINIFRIDNTAVTECKAILCLVKSCVGKSRAVLAFNSGIVINHSFDGTPLEEVFLDNFGNLFNCYSAVKNTFRVNDHDRTESAETEATGLHNLYLFIKTLLCELGNKSFFDGVAV